MFREFQDRRQAGQQLATRLQEYAGRRDVLVLGLARGGVPVAGEVARALRLPLDVFVVRELDVPGHEELPMGAIASGGVRVLDTELLDALHVPDTAVTRRGSEEHLELEQREGAFRSTRATPDVQGCTVLLVNDGLVAGSDMFAAVTALRQAGPAAIVVAVPVAAPDAYAAMRRIADGCVSVLVPVDFQNVDAWYADFSPITDAVVRATLEDAARRQGTDGTSHPPAPIREALARPAD